MVIVKRVKQRGNPPFKYLITSLGRRRLTAEVMGWPKNTIVQILVSPLSHIISIVPEQNVRNVRRIAYKDLPQAESKLYQNSIPISEYE